MNPLTLTLKLQIQQIQGPTFGILISNNGAKQVPKISSSHAVNSHFYSGPRRQQTAAAGFCTEWHQRFWWHRAATSQLFLQPQQMQQRLCKSALMAGLSEPPAAETRVWVRCFQMWTRETVWCFSWKRSSALQHKLCDVIPVQSPVSHSEEGVPVWGEGNHNQPRLGLLLTEGGFQWLRKAAGQNKGSS